MEPQEKRNRKIGLWASAGIHAAVVVLLFFVLAWRAPDPPLPEYGIELNFGLDATGSGDVQPDQTVGDDGESTAEEAVAENTTEPTTESTEADEVTTSAAEEPTASKVESPVTVKEVTKPAVNTKDPVKPELNKPIKENPVNPNTISPKESPTTDAPRKGDAASQGDDTKKSGDKGNEEGKLDANALYGTPGGGGGGTGLNLVMSGWDWADQPAVPQLPDNESGRIVFEIECDENGDITSITSVERTLSPRAEQLLKEMIRKNSLIRTSGGHVPERSKGKLVFVLRTR